jgi:LysR family transcriptional regulator, benzoate and cis,cis-muconate-responsive activator of ben and cat genes
MRYFIAVAEERNFTRAAEKLYMAQPPLSRQIAQLEEELGISLIKRGSRPLELTEAGCIYLEQAKQILSRVDNLTSAMASLKADERQRIVVGFVTSMLYSDLPEIVRRFRAIAPDVELSFLEVVSASQGMALKERQIDIGFGRIRVDDPATRRDILREEPLVVALPVRHRLAGTNQPMRLAILADEPLIVYPRAPRPEYADLVISLFRDHGLEPKVVHEAWELQTAIGLVAAEVGVAIVPSSVMRLRRDDVIYRKLEDVSVTSPVVMSRRANDHSPALMLMCELVHDLMQSDVLAESHS